MLITGQTHDVCHSIISLNFDPIILKMIESAVN